MIPLVEFLHTILGFDLVSPAEAVELIHTDEFVRGTIRLAGIKLNFVIEANCLTYKFGKLADGKFFACAHVDVAVANFAEGWDDTATTLGVVS